MIALLYIERKIQTTESRVFVSSMIDGKQHKARELDMVTIRNHAPRHTWRNPWPWLSLKWLLFHLELNDVRGADFENSLHAFGQLEKR